MDKSDFIISIFENEPLYKKIEVNNTQWSSLISVNTFIIEMYCQNCQKNRSFKAPGLANSTFKKMSEEIESNSIFVALNNKDRSLLSHSFLIDFRFTCTHCGNIHAISLYCSPDGIIKYGQYPSYASGEEREILKYKNIISKYYIELKRSISAYSQHMGIASFVYLRRILEHLVEKEFSIITKPTGHEKFDDKMKLVDKELHIIPKELESEKSLIYSVLSKGVHEYDEEECYNLYPYLKYVITEILDMYIYKKEKEKKLKDISKILSKKIKNTTEED